MNPKLTSKELGADSAMPELCQWMWTHAWNTYCEGDQVFGDNIGQEVDCSDIRELSMDMFIAIVSKLELG